MKHYAYEPVIGGEGTTVKKKNIVKKRIPLLKEIVSFVKRDPENIVLIVTGHVVKIKVFILNACMIIKNKLSLMLEKAKYSIEYIFILIKNCLSACFNI